MYSGSSSLSNNGHFFLTNPVVYRCMGPKLVEKTEVHVVCALMLFLSVMTNLPTSAPLKQNQSIKKE